MIIMIPAVGQCHLLYHTGEKFSGSSFASKGLTRQEFLSFNRKFFDYKSFYWQTLDHLRNFNNFGKQHFLV